MSHYNFQKILTYLIFLITANCVSKDIISIRIFPINCVEDTPRMPDTRLPKRGKWQQGGQKRQSTIRLSQSIAVNL